MLKVPRAQLGDAVCMRAGSDKGHAVCGAMALSEDTESSFQHWHEKHSVCTVPLVCHHVSTEHLQPTYILMSSVDTLTISLLPKRFKGIFSFWRFSQITVKKKNKKLKNCVTTELNHLEHIPSNVCYVAIKVKAIPFSFIATSGSSHWFSSDTPHTICVYRAEPLWVQFSASFIPTSNILAMQWCCR